MNTLMMRLFWLFLMTSILLSCKQKKKSLNDDDIITVKEFFDFFPDKKLPVVIEDTALLAKTSDSLLIKLKILNQFIPDSFLVKDFGKSSNAKIYPIGKTKEKDRETYLFLKAVGAQKRVAYIACFNNDNQFVKAMPIVKTDPEKSKSSYASLDSKFQITTYTERKKGGESIFKRNVYLFNLSAEDFTLILTEPNEELIEEVTNPIDTISKKVKWTGDYVKDKKNFVSFRDSKRPAELQFFVHFEQNNEECKGELKGVAQMVSNNKAVFKDPSGPCVVEFDFLASSVSMKETGGCGNYRDIKCFFEGSFKKKAEPKPKTPPKKK